jgi:hypothetical protein
LRLTEQPLQRRIHVFLIDLTCLQLPLDLGFDALPALLSSDSERRDMRPEIGHLITSFVRVCTRRRRVVSGPLKAQLRAHQGAGR